MSAPENGASTLQRVQSTWINGSNGAMPGQARPKSHYLKIYGLLVDFILS